MILAGSFYVLLSVSEFITCILTQMDFINMNVVEAYLFAFSAVN